MTSNQQLIPAWKEGFLTQVEKLAVHQQGLRHKAISVFVMDKDQVLLQRRALSKYHTPGLWANTCCTHPYWNESSEDCARRRLDEELGIKGLSLEFRDHVEYRAEVGNGLIEHELVDIFVAQTDRRKLSINLNPDEVMETTWVRLHDLAKNTRINPSEYTAWLRIYLAKHADKIFGGLVPA